MFAAYRLVMLALAERYGWSKDWFFDGRRALFSARMSLAQHEEFPVCPIPIHLTTLRMSHIAHNAADLNML